MPGFAIAKPDITASARSLSGVMRRRVQTALLAEQPPTCIGVVRAESCEDCRPARKFPHELVMRKPSERPAVYGSGCEGVPEAKRLAG